MAEASKCVNIVTYPTKMTQRETDLVIESITPVSPNRRHHVVGFYRELLLLTEIPPAKEAGGYFSDSAFNSGIQSDRSC